ncbi:MAG: hypothetical protein IPJ77_12565 [Planctomycetes bacterium]|nr:hypothetical protein [Planctomycetota bacterium]
MDGWQLLVTDDGSPTLVHPVHGEACHSRAGAWLESRERYARACRVRERALELAGRGERVLRLLDVGTGLGLNVAAALDALDGTSVALDVVTLELDASVIERTLVLARSGELHARSSPELARAHAPVLAALERALATRGRDPERPASVTMGDGRLLLLLGDGRETLPTLNPARPFDAVFLDAFSPGVDGALWQPSFLAELARRMAPSAVLSTYSVSLAVRAGLAAAGLRVGPGGRVGTKAAGTLASHRPFPADQPVLDARTARRVARRAARLTAGESARPGGPPIEGGAPPRAISHPEG